MKHTFAYGQGGAGSDFLGKILKKLSKVGPLLPNGSSGGIKRSFTKVYIKILSSTTFRNSGFSCAKSL